MRGFSYSDNHIHGSPFIRWTQSSAQHSISHDDGLFASRTYHQFPDSRFSWRRSLDHQLLLTLSLSNKVEIRSGHVRRAGTSTAAISPASNSNGVQCIALEKGTDRLLLSGGLDGKICLYRLDVHEDDAGRNAFSCARRQPAAIFPVITSRPAGLLDREGLREGHAGAVSDIQWFPEDPPGAFISSSYDGSLLVWDSEYFEVAGRFRLDSKIFISKINIVAQSGLVACGTEKDGIRLCDLRTGDSVHSIKPPTSDASIRALDWAPTEGGHYIAAGTSDGCIRLWDVRKGGDSQSYVMSFGVQHCDHTSDSIERGIGYDATRQSESRAKPTTAVGARVRLHQQGKAMRRPVDWSRVSAAVAHRGTEVVALKYTPSGSHLVSCGNDGQVILWNSLTGKKCQLHFSPQCGKTKLRYDIDVASFGGSGDEILFYPSSNHRELCRGQIAMTPLHSNTGESARLLVGHVDDICAIQLSGDKSRLVTAGRDGMIFVWDGFCDWSHFHDGDRRDMDRRNQFRSEVQQSKSRTDGSEENKLFWQSDDSGDDFDVMGHFVPPILNQYQN